jgi:small subunit ribosomal protein S4e
MYLKRNKVIRALPVPRKGTKYVARANSHANSSVPVIVAVRDMIGLARNSKEVKHMINNKNIKINGKIVKDVRESIRLFSILQLDKDYKLTILPTGRFSFENSLGQERLCKVVNKKSLKNGKTQFNLHDGTNLISKEKLNVGDSLSLSFDGKIKSKIQIGKEKEVFVISGGGVGQKGRIKEIINGRVKVAFEESGKEVELDKSHLIVL